jgi:hypothetical protein
MNWFTSPINSGKPQLVITDAVEKKQQSLKRCIVFLRFMFLKSAFIIAIISYSILSFSQNWKIEKIKVYNSKQKKTTIDSTATGSIALDNINNVIYVVENGNFNTYSFNYCQKIEGDSHYSSYELKQIDLSKPKGNVVITYSDNNEGKLIFSIDEFTKTYYLFSTDSPYYNPGNYIQYLESYFKKIHFDWIVAHKETNGSIFYIQSVPLEKTYNQIKIWVKELCRSKKVKGILYKNVEIKHLMTFDCNSKQVLIGDNYYYDSNKKIIYTVLADYPTWENIVPESIGEMLLNKVCEFLNKK